MKLYSVALFLTKPTGSGMATTLSGRTTWANSEEEALGMVFTNVLKNYKGYSLDLHVVYEIDQELLKEQNNEQYGNNCKVDQCETTCKCR